MHHLLHISPDGTITLLIHGYIGRWSTSAEQVRAALVEVAQSGATSVTVSIHSGGGDVFEGWAIYNTLRTSGLQVTTRVDGIAASMASIILLAGKRVQVSQNSLVMIHDPWTYTEGTAAEIRKAAELLEKVGGLLKSEYVRRTGLDEAEVAAMMAATTWMDPAEAVAKGFADEIVNGDPVEDLESWAALDWAALTRRVAAMAAGQGPQARPQSNHQHHKDMRQIAALLGLPATATEAEIAAALQAREKENETLRKQVEQMAAAEAARRKNEIKALIDGAVQEGRATESERQTLEQLGETGEAGLAVLRSSLQFRTPQAKVASAVIQASAGNPAADRSTWGHFEWLTKDPEGLKAMVAANPDFIKGLPK